MADDAQGEPYLAGLDLTGRTVLVIGAGRVAERRLPRLLAAGARITVVSPTASAIISELATGQQLRWIQRRYVEGDLADSWYVLTATDDPLANAAVSGEAEREHVFCVRSDDATEGTAWTPATAVEGEVLLAVLSRQASRHGSPARTRLLRDRLLDELRRLLSEQERR